MRLSTKGRYAVMALVDLATNSQGRPVSRAGDWSRRQEISLSYLEQLFAKAAPGRAGEVGTRSGRRPAGAPRRRHAHRRCDPCRRRTIRATRCSRTRRPAAIRQVALFDPRSWKTTDAADPPVPELFRSLADVVERRILGIAHKMDGAATAAPSGNGAALADAVAAAE